MKFSTKLTQIAQPYIESMMKKPFLIEACKGTLAVEKFQYYLRVDYPYLINFNRILALSVFKANEPNLMIKLVKSLNGNIRELSQHELYAAKFGVTLSDLTHSRLGPTKYSYTCHELSMAQSGRLIDLLVTMSPCIWGYGEMARCLVKKYILSENSPYSDWIKYYVTPEYTELGEENWRLVDELSSGLTEMDLSFLEMSYLRSFYFEVKTWDAYYAMEEWII